MASVCHCTCLGDSECRSDVGRLTGEGPVTPLMFLMPTPVTKYWPNGPNCVVSSHSIEEMREGTQEVVSI